MTKEDEVFSESCVEVMSGIAASVSVLTLEDPNGDKRGMTITSLSTVSSEPPAILVSVSEGASSHPFMKPGQSFGINLLAADQTNYSIGFSWGKSDDPFGDFPWEASANGTPLLTEAAAHLVCEVEQVVQYHGSAVVLARITDCSTRKDETLVYWRRAYHGSLVPVDDGAVGKW